MRERVATTDDPQVSAVEELTEPATDAAAMAVAPELMAQTFGEYVRLLENADRWAQLALPIDRGTFVDKLDAVRRIRNDVMHFNPDPVPPDSVDKLRNILSMIRQYCD